MVCTICRCLLVLSLCLASSAVSAEDFFLTIGGGYSPDGNQASLEKNVQLFQRTLRELELEHCSSDVFFADGSDEDPDVQVVDPSSVPKANRLMAEFFGSDDKLGLSYRNHQIPDVRGASKPQNIRRWFERTGSRMTRGDRLVLYVTAHGNRSEDRDNDYNTTIATWNNTSIKMEAFVRLLDDLPEGVEVVAVMVQCYSGGFSRFIFNGGDPDRGLSSQSRCGFFATVHDRPAAGCTPEVDEANYVEYSTYFWAALTGRDRTGRTISSPDYDENGTVSFEEAHAYTILTADTIDIPVTTSSAFLDAHSRFGKSGSDLLTDEEPYEVILNLARPSQAAVLEGLSEQLDLTGSDRVVTADRESQPRRGRGRGGIRGRRPSDPAAGLRREIAGDLRKRWPELANVLNPVSVELLTTLSDQFIKAVEGHKDYRRYRRLVRERSQSDEIQNRSVKYRRFLRAVDDVILAENLRRIGDSDKLQQYERLVQAEGGTLAGDREVGR